MVIWSALNLKKNQFLLNQIKFYFIVVCFDVHLHFLCLHSQTWPSTVCFLLKSSSTILSSRAALKHAFQWEVLTQQTTQHWSTLRHFPTIVSVIHWYWDTWKIHNLWEIISAIDVPVCWFNIGICQYVWLSDNSVSVNQVTFIDTSGR